jgi:hypothetical protein
MKLDRVGQEKSMLEIELVTGVAAVLVRSVVDAAGHAINLMFHFR